MLKWKHLLHPVRSASVARNRFLAHVNLRRFAIQCKQHFREDPRYDLKHVSAGFVSRPDSSSDDNALLERICKAYARTTAHAKFRVCYQPTEWWRQLQQACLGPVTRALREGDVTALGGMYARFFRDRCATGLIGVPYGMVDAYLRCRMRDVHRHVYMGDALYRIDYWGEQNGRRTGVAALAGPAIGDPFGVCLDGILVPSGSEYQHYCAQQILSRIESKPCLVGEIGGGYGGMAYYLLRDGGRVTYIDFDVPESIALTSYYLLKAFPQLRALLYGEQDLTPEALSNSDIVLMPLFEMDRMPAGSLELVFSSHVMSDLSESALIEYLEIIRRIMRRYFLYFGDSRAADRIADWAGCSPERLRLLESRSTGWNRHKAPNAAEGEFIYLRGEAH